ncbi:hypothetical protein L228DRAFT_183079 [Xylona heveae TC161]|uniref:Uncharacterized protein n=1 Tax=Xylona heveae (strain CBS 132557 / TC161) TaxID=1328760 RepID=A0A165FGV9_XYLHT|nr:hypothetical protein L228DRAFT_183079 [Xylona heveae TC161]KZF20964.1 hypothetical protein L228DRAFT_183079 [Xylona heveae TC161]
MGGFRKHRRRKSAPRRKPVPSTLKCVGRNFVSAKHLRNLRMGGRTMTLETSPACRLYTSRRTRDESLFLIPSPATTFQQLLIELCNCAFVWIVSKIMQGHWSP